MPHRKQQNGFALFEAMVGLAVIVTITALAFAAMSTATQNANIARLYTLAEEMARDQIDQVEAATPFNPQLSQIPTALTTGTTAVTLPLYIDPATGKTVVTARRTTVIAATSSYNGVTAVVTVAYSYRNRNYSIQMNTLRVSDD